MKVKAVPMFDLHCHSIFSDGELLPSELVRRVEVMGYDAICITDHADESNLEFIITEMQKLIPKLNAHSSTRLLCGIELTHVHPARIGGLVEVARSLGAEIVVCHGETIVEPVIPGTNRAAIEAGVDILAHPGMITEDDAALAREAGVRLELSGRKGHSLTNGHVAGIARKVGARLVINSDGHAPGDFMTKELAMLVGRGAGLSEQEIMSIYEENWHWICSM